MRRKNTEKFIFNRESFIFMKFYELFYVIYITHTITFSIHYKK